MVLYEIDLCLVSAAVISHQRVCGPTQQEGERSGMSEFAVLSPDFAYICVFGSAPPLNMWLSGEEKDPTRGLTCPMGRGIEAMIPFREVPVDEAVSAETRLTYRAAT